MPHYRDTLISIYAANPVAEIQNSAEFRTLLQQYAGNKNFQAERHRIEMAKEWVEAAIDGEWTEQETVQKAIQLLISCRADPKQRDLCHELIVASYSRCWIEARQKYFNTAWEKIQLEYDYFVSFTCRYPNPESGRNPVNDEHKHFIISKIGNAEFRKANRKSENLLADAIDRMLTQPDLKRFFFPVFQYDNSETEKKLENACDNSMVFFQLVQPIMFQPLSGGLKNYCHREWERVYNRLKGSEAEKKNIIYLVAMPNRNALSQVFRYPAYSDWYNHIENKDPPYLPETTTYNASTLADIKRIFDRKLVPEIRSAWYRLIEGAP